MLVVSSVTKSGSEVLAMEQIQVSLIQRIYWLLSNFLDLCRSLATCIYTRSLRTAHSRETATILPLWERGWGWCSTDTTAPVTVVPSISTALVSLISALHSWNQGPPYTVANKRQLSLFYDRIKHVTELSVFCYDWSRFRDVTILLSNATKMREMSCVKRYIHIIMSIY